jgi:hypothetical protein
MAAQETLTRLVAIGSLLAATHAIASPFRFETDTFAFQNATILKYKNGRPTLQRNNDPNNKYAHCCFVMTRCAEQFHKFARFDPHGAPLNDKELKARIRKVARHAPWDKPLLENKRIVFPGYANLREISKAHRELFQQNIGSGFATYFRPGNFRMFFQHSRSYQEKTHEHLDAALNRGELFVGYLSSFPSLTINHTVLIYGRKPANDGLEHYYAYDPNHAESPRELTWSSRDREFAYQKDIDFVGGFVRVYQVYGKLLQ